MQIQLTDPFLKGLRQTPNHIQRRVLESIAQCRIAQSVGDIAHRKPLYAKKNRVYFRLRIGDYRVGVQVIDDILHFQNIGLRGDFYKTYPPK